MKFAVNQVEMAINAKNMKSIQYPFMPEEGMLEPSELKIHQASHARYFEDFLKYVEYDYLHLEKGVSPVELLRPDDLHAVIERIIREEESDN